MLGGGSRYMGHVCNKDFCGTSTPQVSQVSHRFCGKNLTGVTKLRVLVFFVSHPNKGMCAFCSELPSYPPCPVVFYSTDLFLTWFYFPIVKASLPDKYRENSRGAELATSFSSLVSMLVVPGVTQTQVPHLAQKILRCRHDQFGDHSGMAHRAFLKVKFPSREERPGGGGGPRPAAI